MNCYSCKKHICAGNKAQVGGKNVVLCHTCNKVHERKCRVCGCTEDHACRGGCYWVSEDLCSACVDTEEAAEIECKNTDHDNGPCINCGQCKK